MNKNGFFLFDALLALVVVLVGTTAVMALLLASARSRGDAHTTKLAWEILSYARSLSSDHLESLSERFFDDNGQPTVEQGKYSLVIETRRDPGQVVYLAELTWSTDGVPRRLHFERKEWRPNE